MRKKQHQELYTYMNGIHVGILSRGAAGQLIFTYDHSWLERTNSRPISLSLPLTEATYKGRIVSCYFDNLLPDNELILERIQARFSAPSKKAFDLLSFIGGDCVGALQLLTESDVNKLDVKKIQAHPVDDKAIANILKQYRIAPLGMNKDNDFRISIAGAQEKTALLWHKNKWHLPHGTTPTSHILKLPIGNIQASGMDLSESIENEWICLKILAAFNLPVNTARIAQFEDVKTLVVERFDRRWSEDNRWLIRLPQEDLCQALSTSPGLKYESHGGPGIQNIMSILLGSQHARADRYKFMKAVFLYWVMGAIDGHAKNFSLHIKAQGRYELTPFYDVISAYPLADKRQLEWKNLKMAMSLRAKNRNYSWSTMQLRQWLAMAERCQFSQTLMQEIIDDVCDNMDEVLHKVSQSLPANFPAHITEPIFSGMRKIKDRCLM